MDGNVSKGDSDEDKNKVAFQSMSEAFRKVFPRYLAIGMSYEEYWEKESWLVKSYREAQKEKRTEKDYYAWLNGIYVLKALQTGVPVILNGIAKQVVTLPEFPDRPIDFSENRKKEQEKKQMELQRAKMQEMAEAFNRTFRKKHKDNNQEQK